MRKFIKFIRNIILLVVLGLGIFIFLRSGKKKVLIIGTSPRIGSEYHNIAKNYNYDLYISSGLGNVDDAREMIRDADGVIFAGGMDFDPSLYGSNHYDLVEEYFPDDDRDDLKLLSLAIEENKPILGICRGMQLINIYYGGSLYEDIPTQVGDYVSHRGDENTFSYHNISFNENSTIYDKLGGETTRNVNSMHHEGIKTLADGLMITAQSDDGIIEAIENPYYNSFMMGVQWHPEYNGGELDSLTKIIFDVFTNSL